ncbi:hypothetical protein CkaCkLH20_05354 [Colletotrichum karsti]|uniref:Zn(2)-C6 fungal-type domain-containing protein n=1 Tax=Colletotrichum karsti TaxID=1095194 RepID=A0A9P6I4B2_9PEZI|nr:uncharacterized protein CkaCkLH20_05354 [Colletotrichum karsti]KAF9877088.1 hypothetical protein CkaCkLH20_05354 [Colletotrichum karsti]
MPPKLAACDPCRLSKLACDHAKPVCSRCRARDQASRCAYRDRPFKKRSKRRQQETSGSASGVISSSSIATDTAIPTATSSAAAAAAVAPLTKPRRYPNPGYLGSLSYTTLFYQISSAGVDNEIGKDTLREPPCRIDSATISQGANLIEELVNHSELSRWISLVNCWLGKGVNLALAGPFTKQCIGTAQLIIIDQCLGKARQDFENVSRSLFSNSCRSPSFSAADTIDEFALHLGPTQPRWEALGIFFAAMTRAAIDLVTFDHLYVTAEERRSVQRKAMQYSDRCLEWSLSLDCLNDLQLFLQYENFILHSFVNGDQSYLSWRRLGDVASSLFALGYHEQARGAPEAPEFLRSLRQAAFARTYSADKNVSIFLGRPPRILRKYCPINIWDCLSRDNRAQSLEALQLQFEQTPDGKFDYMADTRWSALCAGLKEETLELFKEKDPEEKIRQANIIEEDAQAIWDALPNRFRLESALKQYEDRSAVERDFMVSAKLNHLHVLFLLRFALTRRMQEPDTQLIDLSANMLKVIVESVVLKNNLANSGTSVVWRVAYYGLASAGVLCVALLNRSLMSQNSTLDLASIIQDLNVLVAEVETGALLHFDDPNYALLAEATSTVKSVVGRFISGQFSANPAGASFEGNNPSLDINEHWDPWDGWNTGDFETDFWMSIAEHPSMA